MLHAQIHDHDNSRLATVSPPDAEVARNERTARAPCNDYYAQYQKPHRKLVNKRRTAGALAAFAVAVAAFA